MRTLGVNSIPRNNVLRNTQKGNRGPNNIWRIKSEMSEYGEGGVAWKKLQKMA